MPDAPLPTAPESAPRGPCVNVVGGMVCGRPETHALHEREGMYGHVYEPSAPRPVPETARCETCNRSWQGYTSFDGEREWKTCRDYPMLDGTWTTHPFNPAPPAEPVEALPPGIDPTLCICPTHHPGAFKACPVHLQWPWTEPNLMSKPEPVEEAHLCPWCGGTDHFNEECTEPVVEVEDEGARPLDELWKAYDRIVLNGSSDIEFFAHRHEARAAIREEATAAQGEELTRLRILRYSPTGDNHHNAADCPYCSERRQEQLDENRAYYVAAEEARTRAEAAEGALRDIVRAWLARRTWDLPGLTRAIARARALTAKAVTPGAKG